MSGHLKRLVVPKNWSIHKKESKWAPSLNCGGYKSEESIPLITIIRDYLHYTDNANEARRIVHSGKILVDAKIRKDPNFGVGLMGVISIPIRKENFRVVLNTKGRFELINIPDSEAKKKLCKIMGKKFVKKGVIQLNFHDGRTLLLENPNGYQVADTLVLDLPTQNILAHIPLKKGSLALVTHGHNIGKICNLKEIQEIKNTSTKVAVLKGKDKEEIQTLKDYLFFVGEKKAEVTIEP